MSQGVRMKVTQQIVGSHDPRILVGSDPKSGFSWGGGEDIVVTPELATNYEKSGIAQRVQEKRESAAIEPAKAVQSAPKGRTPVVPEEN